MMADITASKPTEMDSEEPPSENGNDDDQQSPEKQSPTMTKWGKTGFFVLPAVAVACAALIILIVANAGGQAGGGNIECTTAPPLQLRRLSYFDESALKGYDRCQDLEDDLKEALEIIANITIDSFAVSKFRNYGYPYILRGDEEPGFGGGLYYSEGEPPVMSDGGTSTGGSSAAPGSGENSFGTNNQVDGVDEADQVKSDGNHIFVAYGDMIIVTDAKTGTELSRTQLPTDDENGIPRCDDVKGFVNGDTECYNGSGSYRGGGRSDIKVASLMLHKSTLAVVASTSLVLQNRVPGLMNDRNTRIFIYDVSDIPSDLSPLTLMARKDLQGSYQTARSIGGYSHIVTSSNLDTHYHVGTHLNPWDKRYIDMKEEEYRSQAFLEAQKKIPHYAGILTSELRDLSERNGVVDDECSFISKVAIMLKQQATSTSTVLPSFTDASSLKTLTQVYSLDLQQEFDVDTGTITTTSSGVFFPTSSYTSNVYASDTKLVIAGESYAENEEGQWIEHTILLVYDLQNATSVPFAVGDVPGSLLNQFSMDHYYEPSSGQDYLRIATTSWGRWGAVDDLWRQIQTSESQVSVLHIPTANNENAGGLELVGSVGEIGVGERIYSARFFGERAYVVTFRQIDPFYTIDLSDPTQPMVVGELKIPGFSNYLHPVNDTLILALGQDVDETTGRTKGLQISLFDVSDFANPQRVNQFVEEEEWSTSEAQYDHRAFRYLPESKLLILPLYINSWYSSNQFFDGFVVYDVDETRAFKKKFNISHVSGDDAFGNHICWGAAELPSRSLVFEGNVTTLKGHTALSHNLDTEELWWQLNLDKGRSKNEECNIWHHDGMVW